MNALFCLYASCVNALLATRYFYIPESQELNAPVSSGFLY